MSERKLAFAMLAILVLQVSVPILPVDATLDLQHQISLYLL